LRLQYMVQYKCVMCSGIEHYSLFTLVIFFCQDRGEPKPRYFWS